MSITREFIKNTLESGGAVKIFYTVLEEDEYEVSEEFKGEQELEAALLCFDTQPITEVVDACEN